MRTYLENAKTASKVDLDLFGWALRDIEVLARALEMAGEKIVSPECHYLGSLDVCDACVLKALGWNVENCGDVSANAVTERLIAQACAEPRSALEEK